MFSILIRFKLFLMHEENKVVKLPIEQAIPYL